jgi:hypothetical protein
MTDTQNGHDTPAAVGSTDNVAGRFPEHALKRLSRAHARMMGAQEVAQVAAAAAQQLEARFNEALAESCDEIGVSLPPGPVQAQVDWRTGAFSFAEGAPQNP